MRTRASIDDAHLVITGTRDGKQITFEADLDWFDLEYDVEYEAVQTHWGYDSKIFPSYEEYKVIAKLSPGDEGHYCTWRYEDEEIRELVQVQRTARIEATDNTVKAAEEARVRAGVPEYAKYRGVERYRTPDQEYFIEDWTQPRPVTLEFYWNEEV